MGQKGGLRAFSSEVGTGSREENAIEQDSSRLMQSKAADAPIADVPGLGDNDSRDKTMLKDLLCVVEAGERPSAALAQAIAIAKGYTLVPQYVAAVPGPPPLSNILGSDLVETLIQKAKAEAADTAELVGKKILELSREQGCEAKVIEESRPLVETAEAIANIARCYDLTLLECLDSHVGSSSAIFERVLLGSGRPVLLVPVGGAPVERFRTAVIAWDGSMPSARAVASALALFPDLNEVFILTVVGEKNLDKLVPGGDIAAHIRRHGIRTTVACVDLDVEDENAGPPIARFAKEQKVDLMVMGGYGHSRLREFILGGVTEYLTREAPAPLLLAH